MLRAQRPLATSSVIALRKRHEDSQVSLPRCPKKLDGDRWVIWSLLKSPVLRPRSNHRFFAHLSSFYLGGKRRVRVQSGGGCLVADGAASPFYV